MIQILTKENIRVGTVIICTDHPEWGTWGVIRKYDESVWEIRGDAGDRTLVESEFHFWHLKEEMYEFKYAYWFGVISMTLELIIMRNPALIQSNAIQSLCKMIEDKKPDIDTLIELKNKYKL